MQHDLGSATSFSGRQLSFEKGWKVSSTWKSWRLQMALESSLLRHRSPSPSLSFSLSLSLCLSLSFCFNCPFHALLYYCCWTERLVGEKKPRLFEKNRFGFEKSKLPIFFSWFENVPKKIFFATGAKQDEKNARYLGQLDILDRCSECKIRRHFVSSLGSTDRIQVGEKKNYNKLLLNKYKGTCCLAWGFFS